MIISPKHKLLFIHIPKTAGISFQKLIEQNDKKTFKFRNTHAWLRYEDYKKYKKYYKVVIIRNSFRLCSSCWKFETSNPRPKFNDRRGMTFKNWLLWKSNCEEIDHEIFPRQLPFFKHNNKILVDKIIHYENITKEIEDLCKKFNWKNNFNKIKIHSYGTYNWKEPYEQDPNNIELVKKICKEDIKYFDYLYK